ncbi:MAG: T9SS type A sorting domain-containing protein, partial [Edaphocola sp.]
LFDNPLGIEPVAGNSGYQWLLYPNPAAEVLHLRGDYTGMLSVRIYDLTGRVVLRQEIQGQDGNIDVSALRPGLFLVNIYDHVGQRLATVKVQKE